MKKTLFILLFISFKMFGQSVLLTPNQVSHQNLNADSFIGTGYSSPYYMIGRSAKGTSASPSAVLIEDWLLFLGARAYNGSTFSATSSASIIFSASQNWTPSANGSNISFSTTANNTQSRYERMTIKHNGYVGIGLLAPDEILDVNGRMRVRHNGNTSGIWMSNSANSLSVADGAFYGMINDTQAGIYIGNAWRFAVNSNGNVVNTGFTQLGNDVPVGAASGATAPSIKTLKLIGTTAATQGGSASVTHGLSFTKILSYSVLVNIGGSTPALITPEYTGDTALKYTAFCVGSSVFLINSPANSSGLLSKPFKVFITYEE